MTVLNDNGNSFDFSAAVDAARRDFPVETAGVTFVDLSAPGAAAAVRSWIENGNLPYAEKELLSQNLPRKNGFTRLRSSDEIIVGVKSRPASHYLENPAHEAAYAFMHELGHALTSLHLPDDARRNAPPHIAARHEIAADVFAVLRGIGTGAITRKDAEMLSFSRGTTLPWTHVTSQAVDTVLAEFSDADMKRMPPQKMRDLALSYAETYAPRPGEIEALAKKLQWIRMEEIAPDPQAPTPWLKEKLKNTFGKMFGRTPKPARQMTAHRLTQDEWLENVADVAAHAEPGTLAAHTAGKILSSVFNRGHAGYPQPKSFDVSAPKWDDLRRKFGPSPA